MKKVIRRIFLLLLSVMCFAVFSSCEKPGEELADLMIMQGIGIDFENGQYTVTVEILNNEQNGSPGGDSTSENKTKIYSATGETVSQALRNLTTKSGNLPLFAHNRVIILGESTAKEDLRDILDFFTRDYDSRPSQLLCVAKGMKAEELINAKLLKDTVKSEILENLLEESSELSLVPKVRIVDAVNYTKNEVGGVLLPAVELEKKGEEENYKLFGCAVFGVDSVFLKYMPLDQCEGIAFLNNEIKNGYIVGDLENGKKALFLINRGTTDFEIKRENGILVYSLNIKVSCDLDEVQGADYFTRDNGLINNFEKSAEAALIKKAEKAIEALQGEDGCDTVRFSKRLRLKNTSLYNSLKENWDNEFKNIQVKINADVTLRRIGEETFHGRKN